MTELEAMRNLAIVAGASVDEVRRAFGVLREFKVDAEPLMNYLKALGKQMQPTPLPTCTTANANGAARNPTKSSQLKTARSALTASNLKSFTKKQ